MKLGKLLSLAVAAVFIGSFLMGVQVSSEPTSTAPLQQQPSKIGDQLFDAWVKQNKDYQKPSVQVLKKTLTPLQFDVTQKDGTERSFKNEYWNNKREGIYVDVVSGEPLFSSIDKYKSGTGWPSFYRAISEKAMVHKADNGIFGVRTELRSRIGDNHLGHIFDDGPEPTGKRYCINSASLRFIAKESLVAEGYGEFATLFEE